MKKLISIPILVVLIGLWGYQAIQAGPISFKISDAIAGYISTVTENVQDAIDTIMSQVEWETIIGAEFKTEALMKALTPKAQAVTVGSGTSTAFTPTAGYGVIYADLQCTDAVTTFTMVEAGVLTNALIYVRNVSSGANEGNVCRINYTASNFEHEGNVAGNYLTLNDNGRDSFVAVKLSDRYVVISNNTSSRYVSGIGAKTQVEDDADDFAAAFASIAGDTSNMYGGLFVCNASGTAALPDPAVNMNFGVHNRGAVTPIFEPFATGTDDTIILNGVTCGQGKYITSAGAATDTASFRAALAADTWEVIAVGYTCEP